MGELSACVSPWAAGVGSSSGAGDALGPLERAYRAKKVAAAAAAAGGGDE